MRTRLATLPWVCWAALALIAAQLAVRAVVAFGGFFYWDDLILIGRAGTTICSRRRICSTTTTVT